MIFRLPIYHYEYTFHPYTLMRKGCLRHQPPEIANAYLYAHILPYENRHMYGTWPVAAVFIIRHGKLGTLANSGKHINNPIT
jgi:hypothetical protein